MGSKKRIKVELARELRKRQTKAERVIWWLLRNKMFLGYKFRRQYVFRGFIIDFYCPTARLGIELEGGIHSKQREYDALRQEAIEEYGVKLLRFKNFELFNDPISVLDRIINELTISRPSPL